MREPEDLWTRLATWHRSLPPEAVFACSAAAWMHGLGGAPTEPVQVFLPATSGRRSRTGLIVRRSQLKADEVIEIRGLPVTTLQRTIRDLCLFGAPLDALIAIDMALQKRRTDKARLLRDAVTKKGRRGAARLRRLVELAAPAESPMETRLRWLIFNAGLPRPEVQVDLHDAEGGFLGRADLYYPAARLVVEFDGGNHRERLVSDDRRQNLLIGAGFRILRFTAADVHSRPGIVAAQLRGSLA